MNAKELHNRIIASGADENGIRDRFCGNVELYQSCFLEFIKEPSFVTLRNAVYTHDYKQAFEAAHALKGLSGNLGLTGFYNAIRTLTNSLRNEEYDNVEKEYEDVERQHERLKRISADEPAPEQTPAVQDAPQAAPSTKQKSPRFFSLLKDKNNRLLIYLSCITILAVVAVGVLLAAINITHSRNVTVESGQHLIEINNQIKLYIEENIDNDWKIAQSVGDSILGSAYVDDDPAVLEMLQKKQSVWGVSALAMYTKNGHCIYADGSAESTDIGSMIVYNAHKQGKYLSIIESKLFFTVPLDTTLTFHGSEIAAISIVRDISSFVDEMDFSSFQDAAWMYITDQNGIILSSLSGPSTIRAFNMQSVIDGMKITPLNNTDSPKDFLDNPKAAVFLFSNEKTKLYGVSVPIATKAEPMSLFYFVPENAVNSIMSGFSSQLLSLSMVIVVLFTVISFSSFIALFRIRKKMFTRAIRTRERMFDLLVKNTKTAFGLFKIGKLQPEYQSANTSELIGDSYWTLEKPDTGFCVHNENRIETDNTAIINETLREWDGKSTFRSGYLCNTKSATPTYFIFELYPVDDNTDDYVGIAQDVTPIYAREEAVKNAMESARQANNAKTHFLSSMSHDIRTPMNAIMNMSSFALECIDQPKKLSDYLRIIHDSSEHLLALINDVLDMSRIESGQMLIASAPFDILEEMQRQVEIIRPLCKAKNQNLITDFSELKNTKVVGDALKLAQIVINLLSNAMKFTPEKGAVRFIARELPSLREGIVILHFTVEDNGIGISESDIKRIFEPFNRSSDKEASKIDGTGLGLAIVKNYVDALGGTVHCQSEYGEGTTFTVEMFFTKADMSVDRDNKPAALINASFLGLHALVAEDNPVNQLIAKEVLERMGFILDFVDDGSAAVQRFCESIPNTYDVIYMDIQMPVMDGNSATEAIRACNHPQAKTIPIIAMTANAFADDIEKSRVAGMDGYVAKPIVSFELAEQTKNAIEKKRGST